MTDWQLIQAYGNGDEEAFATLVEKYYQLVYSTACRQVGDSHLAQDVTQCVFLLLARKAKGLSPQTAIGGWFLRTARFVARDVIRKSSHWRHLENEAVLSETLSSPGLDPSGPLASLEEALLVLPEKEQACLLARYYEGKNLKEIAADLDISEDAAQKRVARGLDRMRLFFHRHGFKISIAAIPMIFTAGFSSAAEGVVTQTGTRSVLAALKGESVSRGLTDLTAATVKALTHKQWMAAGTKMALALALIAGGSGWIWINQKPPTPPTAAFPIDDERVTTLGKHWSQVMQRAALVRHEFPQTPAANDPRIPSLREENKALFRDRMMLSWDIQSLSQQYGAETILSAYVTTGLTDLLGLSPAQQAFIFDLVRRSLPEGIKEKEGSDILESRKPELASAVREQLSIRQRWRFDDVCGPKGEYFLINRTGYSRGPGYMAWQDWLAGGGIITPAEAMEAVPPDRW